MTEVTPYPMETQGFHHFLILLFYDHPAFCGAFLFLPQFVGRGLPLDKSSGMGIIVNRRGRCDKWSAPFGLGFYWAICPQKPSPARVAVFAFQSLDSYRDRMTQNMNRKHEKHVCHPPFGAVTNRLPFIAASLVYIISRLSVFVKSSQGGGQSSAPASLYNRP